MLDCGPVTGRIGGIRILALVSDAYGGSGGISNYNTNFFAACTGSNLVEEILVLARNKPVGMNITPDKIVSLPTPRGGKIGYGLQALTYSIRERPLDVIFCGHIHLVGLAFVAARFSGARLWVQLHGVEAWTEPRGVLRWCIERADTVTCVSRYTRNRFLHWASIPPWKVRVLPNTVDSRFKPQAETSLIVERYGLAGKKVLLTVGRLSTNERYKGHDRVIEAMPELIKRFKDLVYVVAGEGDDKRRLESLAQRNGVDNNVRLIGRVTDNELPDLYSVADVFVMPSTGEGFGIVFLEALRCGVPAIGGKFDGSRDALVDGDIGILVDPEDGDELVDAVSGLLSQGRGSRAQSAVDRFKFENFAVFTTNLLTQ